MDGMGQGRRGRRMTGWRAAGVVLAAGLAMAAAPPGQVKPPEPPESAAGDAALAGSLLTTARVTRPRRAACGEPGKGGEIVVCGADHGEQWRVPSTADSDPESRQGTDNGVVRAPNVSSLPDCRHGCKGFGKAPPPLYIIDLRKMPEAPAGSDADRIAKGEISER